MRLTLTLMLAAIAGPSLAQPQQQVRVAATGTHLETADGKPFLFVADTCWTGPALSSDADWAYYLADRKAKGFTAVQFNLASPWRTAPTDSEGRVSYRLSGGKLELDPAFYDKAEARVKAVVEAGMLPVPVLAWANTKGDPGIVLGEADVVQLVSAELDRLGKYPALWILGGDNGYKGATGQKWQRIGKAVAQKHPGLLMTTHPNGENFPWDADGWQDQTWLSVLSYQSGHGDSTKSTKWLTTGPATRSRAKKPIINLEPPYEGHNGYATRKPHSALSTRRATYWSLLVTPTAGVTYGGHGVWSWHTRPGEEPTGHKGTGIAKVWRDALQLPFATQIIHLRAIFESVPWTALRPAQQLLTTQPGDQEPKKFVAVAATPDGAAFIAYSPAGGDGLMALKPELLAGKSLLLVNPVTGARTPTTAATLKTDAAKAVSVDGDVVLQSRGTR